jgi:hypothetical protein
MNALEEGGLFKESMVPASGFEANLYPVGIVKLSDVG